MSVFLTPDSESSFSSPHSVSLCLSVGCVFCICLVSFHFRVANLLQLCQSSLGLCCLVFMASNPAKWVRGGGHFGGNENKGTRAELPANCGHFDTRSHKSNKTKAKILNYHIFFSSVIFLAKESDDIKRKC